MATAKPLKLKAKVRATRRNGETIDGVVHLIEAKTNGTWVTVNSGDKKSPVLVTVRESAIERL